MSNNKRDALLRNGFVHFPKFLSGEFLEKLKADSAKILVGLDEEHRERFKSNGSLCNFADHSEFADLVRLDAVFSLLKELGASDPKWLAGYLISKSAGGPPLFWHQDCWGWDNDISYQSEPMQLFFMYYLVDTNRHNGCLRVVPGSHRKWHELHGLSAAHDEGLATVKDPKSVAYSSHSDEVAIEVDAGDLIVGDARLLHSAYANSSENERPLLTLWYIPNFGSLPEAMQARLRAIYERVELDVDAGETQPITVDDWPADRRKLVSDIVPDYKGDVAPLQWNRQPQKDRMEP